MNKTIIININGIVFHIEEDAYDALRSYMIDVKKHFAYTEDSKEIVGDIENRIAEMFNERIVPGKKEVITMQDVEEVCAQMGKVSDFESDNAGDSYDYSRQSYYGSGYSGTRKLFRDPDDKVFGGVCSGLGHYLDIETLWVRLVMVLLFVFAGTGFLLYIILWIVVPIAKTRADRMAMRGEAPNLQNFKKNFEEEMEGLRGNFTMAGERIKPGLNKAADSLEGAANFIAKAFIVFLKVIGALIIFGLSAGIVALLVCLILAIPDWNGDGFGGLYDPDFPLYLVPESYKGIVIVAAFFSLAIPLLALIILAIRIVFNRRIAGSYVGFGLLVLWLVAAGTLTYYTIQTAQDFREDASIVQERLLAPFPAYYVDVNDVNVIKKVDSSGNRLDSLGTIIKSNRKRGKFRNMNSVDIKIIKGETNSPAKLVQEFHARGKNFDLAAKRAERIIYNVNQQEQHIVFDNNSTLPQGELMRDQRVSIKMLLPVGAKLFLSNEADNHIRNLPVWQCRENFPEENRASYTEWIMTEEGLKCIAEMKKEEEHQADSVHIEN
ncbi:MULTISPECIES: PspC domain-containing protein [Olivibacter]|uniref:PspC domain-containing protein n=1 Tax=Olivibacter jilunii TaxID=985016 RepID=A0ABW6B8K8_9SPHI|nr:PspC domain-containing protein [Olivibacter sp. UJ_SKK_5.1]MDX3912211.1 PspC domain-containing protein [Pseudosphingobacterium sp.]